jgi:hypothetical protein
MFLIRCQIETKVFERRHNRSSVFRPLRTEEIGVLSCVRVTQQNGAGFSNEEISRVMPRKRIADFFRLAILKRCHSLVIW